MNCNCSKKHRNPHLFEEAFLKSFGGIESLADKRRTIFCLSIFGVSQVHIKLGKPPQIVSIADVEVGRHATINAALFSVDLLFEFVSMGYVLGANH